VSTNDRYSNDRLEFTRRRSPVRVGPCPLQKPRSAHLRLQERDRDDPESPSKVLLNTVQPVMALSRRSSPRRSAPSALASAALIPRHQHRPAHLVPRSPDAPTGPASTMAVVLRTLYSHGLGLSSAVGVPESREPSTVPMVGASIGMKASRPRRTARGPPRASLPRHSHRARRSNSTGALRL
jgi:hypothetical protein